MNKPMFTKSFTISIHALREEGDKKSMHRATQRTIFLSTPSARRATKKEAIIHTLRAFLSTPSARRATCSRSSRRCGNVISIHALREEGDRGTG